MTTDKRKTQLSEAQKRTRAKKKKEGLVNFTYLIKREWRKPILEFIKSLKKGDNQ